MLAGSVDDIFTSTIEQLMETEFHPNRSFSFADLKFFKQWYEKQTDETRDSVKMLIENGKLDLVGGAYVPPDQALNDVDAMLDNFMVGNKFLKQEFDIVPKVAWQLDDFGVSAGFTRLA